MEYDAFGNEMTLDSVLEGGAGTNREVPFRFSTKYTDSETSLSYYGYRYYSAEMGRWLNRDPIEERGGLNLYKMVGNDVIDNIDVLGLQNPTPVPAAQYNLSLLNIEYGRGLDQCSQQKSSFVGPPKDCKKGKGCCQVSLVFTQLGVSLYLNASFSSASWTDETCKEARGAYQNMPRISPAGYETFWEPM